MTVYRRRGRWHYDFWLAGKRYTSPVGLDSRDDAEEAQAIRKRRLKRQAAGLEALDASETPRFSHWAGVTLKWMIRHKGLTRPDAAKNTLRMVLAFWGQKPRATPVPDGLYLNLRLGDPIQRPELLEQFEDWMTARGLSGARKNHYRSACSMLYRVALLPPYRRLANVRENPFVGVPRDRVPRRLATLTPEQLIAWIESAPEPVMIAVTIGALAPALRFQNVAELRRRQIDPDKTRITLTAHKAKRATSAPLTVPISDELRTVLEAVEARWPTDSYVVPLEGERYWQLQKLVRASLEATDIPYGRALEHGVTFHVLRHALATWLAQWGVSTALRQQALGHQTPQMAAWYTHLAGTDAAPVMGLIGTKLPLAEVVTRRLNAPITRRDSGGTRPAKSSER